MQTITDETYGQLEKNIFSSHFSNQQNYSSSKYSFPLFSKTTLSIAHDRVPLTLGLLVVLVEAGTGPSLPSSLMSSRLFPILHHEIHKSSETLQITLYLCTTHHKTSHNLECNK